MAGNDPMAANDPFTESPPTGRRRRTWFYGWTIVIIVSVISFAGGVETNPVLGVFQGPMTEDFGWSRAIYTLPMSIGSFLGGFGALLVGPIMDRYGARWIMATAITLMGLTFVLMAGVQELWHHFALQIIGRAVIASTFFMVVGVVIPKWFILMRGRAVAFANLGQRVGQITFPVMAERILLTSSWRTAWIAMGITVWVSSLLPTILFLRRRPEDRGELPDGVDIRDATGNRRASQTRDASAVREVSFSRRMALRTPAFYLIAGAISVQSFITTSIHFHWFSYLTDNGVSSGVAVISLSLSPLISMPVSIVAGFIAERVPVQKLMAASYYMMALSITLFLFADNTLIAYVFGLSVRCIHGHPVHRDEHRLERLLRAGRHRRHPGDGLPRAHAQQLARAAHRRMVVRRNRELLAHLHHHRDPERRRRHAHDLRAQAPPGSGPFSLEGRR